MTNIERFKRLLSVDYVQIEVSDSKYSYKCYIDSKISASVFICIMNPYKIIELNNYNIIYVTKEFYAIWITIEDGILPTYEDDKDLGQQFLDKIHRKGETGND